MAEKEPKPRAPRTRSSTTTVKKVTRKTTTRTKAVADTVAELPVYVAATPATRTVEPPLSTSRYARGMSLGFLLSAIAVLSAISAGSLYIGYTAEGQINVNQRLAEAPSELSVDGEVEGSEAGNEAPAPQGIPFGVLEIAGDAAVPPPTPSEATSTEASTTTETDTSEESEDATASTANEAAEPVPVEAVPPPAPEEASN